ncbi:MAG: hypothetical protein U1E05_09360 [Patescibacteria group bacterium]|nr:hypothetical protein [Patescibacteria group bacterium]
MRHVLVSRCLLVVALCGLVSLHAAAADAGRKMQVATCCVDVTPPLGFPSYPSNKPLETVETPLLAKGIVLDDGRQRVVLCAVDWCGLCASAHGLFRKSIADAAQTDVSNVAVHTVHQHTAPYIPTGSLEVRDRAGNPPDEADPPVLRQVAERLGAAARESLGQFQPFNAIGTGQAKVDRVASARRILTPDGKICTRWSACTDPDLRAEPEGRIDPMLKTITLAQDDKPLVRIHFYATHPQSFYGDARVCYDVPGFARERLEEKEKVFQIYFTGCAGDVVMGKYNDRSPEARTQLTDRLYAGMEASVAATQMAPVDGFTWRAMPVTLPLKDEPGYDVAKNRALMEDAKTSDKDWMQAARRIVLAEWFKQPIELGLLRIGPADLVYLPGESVIEFQLFTQTQHPNRFTAVAAYGDLATGYICEEKDFAEGGYEPSASHVVPKSEGILKDAIRKLLEDSKQ